MNSVLRLATIPITCLNAEWESDDANTEALEMQKMDKERTPMQKAFETCPENYLHSSVLQLLLSTEEVTPYNLSRSLYVDTRPATDCAYYCNPGNIAFPSYTPTDEIPPTWHLPHSTRFCTGDLSELVD